MPDYFPCSCSFWTEKQTKQNGMHVCHTTILKRTGRTNLGVSLIAYAIFLEESSENTTAWF